MMVCLMTIYGLYFAIAATVYGLELQQGFVSLRTENLKRLHRTMALMMIRYTALPKIF